MVHTSDEKARYNCDKCGYKATKEGNLKKHVELKHEGFCYYCDQCEYKAKEARTLKRQISTKHEKACNQCEYKGETNIDLKLHFETVHEGILYFCVQCGFKTKQGTCLVPSLRILVFI